MNLRPAAATDLADIERLLVANNLPLDGIPATLENFLVAEEDGETVGAIGLEIFGDAALLRSVVVDESVRGSEIGARLVEGALSKARVLRVGDVYLLTIAAEKYFSRFGFTVVSREEAPAAMLESAEFTAACPASAVLMKRAR